jgi:hypothetical protein
MSTGASAKPLIYDSVGSDSFEYHCHNPREEFSALGMAHGIRVACMALIDRLSLGATIRVNKKSFHQRHRELTAVGICLRIIQNNRTGLTLGPQGCGYLVCGCIEYMVRSMVHRTSAFGCIRESPE